MSAWAPSRVARRSENAPGRRQAEPGSTSGQSSQPELTAELVAYMVRLVAQQSSPSCPASPRDLLAFSAVCKTWERAFDEDGSMWRALLKQQCPMHPLLEGPGPSHCSDADEAIALREAYVHTALGSRLICGRPTYHIRLPLSLVSEGRDNARRVRLNTVILTAGRIVAMVAGRLTVTSLSPVGKREHQILHKARTDRLSGVVLCEWPLQGEEDASGPLGKTLAMATASNPWAARRGSVVEVWQLRSGGHGDKAADTADLMASFTQDPSVIALAVSPAHGFPEVVLVAFGLRCARGSRLCVKAISRTQTLGHLSIPAVDHTICALGWAYCSIRKAPLLIGGSTKGITLVWALSPVNGSWESMTFSSPAYPEDMPRLRAVWAFRSLGPSRGGVALIGESATGVVAVATSEISPFGKPAASHWKTLHALQGAEIQASDVSWQGESAVVMFRDGSIRMYHPVCGRCLGMVYVPKRQYLDRAQVAAISGSGGWPPALLSASHDSQGLQLHLHTTAAPELLPYLCPECGLACDEMPHGLQCEDFETLGNCCGPACRHRIVPSSQQWIFMCRRGHATLCVGAVQQLASLASKGPADDDEHPIQLTQYISAGLHKRLRSSVAYSSGFPSCIVLRYYSSCAVLHPGYVTQGCKLVGSR
eukprot:CAMPEP_0117675594 /NCGR_PEP_ID=MMETSP0804-20121206/15694_1 /TAXON_ID=1074897 /ORGANISM="Tetraselmis astigmatica, Strain CCMP880" /LENGTH=649 /DNA_ID=CAMNT_0005484619 /DNA_START=912 /DNA_END=2861 /DNA_ORIENTATION=-